MVSKSTLAALVLALLSACAPGNDVSPTGDAAITSFSTTPFYVDFRTRPYFAISHTFIAYGAQDPTGHPLERKTVGFFPPGGAVGLLVGVVAITGEVGAEDYYADLPSAATFHRNLTAEQYESLTRYIESERSKPQIFNLIFNNCNDFVAGAAHAVGLKAPFLRMLPPPLFIMLLAQMNS
jgi:hypothetical protein